MSIFWILALSLPFVLYIACSLILRHGLIRNHRLNVLASCSVSVIVAARNEAETILDCLASLAELEYPKDQLEIIIVNDRSEDDTGTIIAQFVAEKSQFKTITITAPISTLSGKASAISQGIEQSRGEIIFITDADCVVPKNWITQMSRYFTDDVGMVAGFTLLKPIRGWFDRMQNLDWAYLLTVAAGAAGLGLPLTCMGNNFAFRRSAYQQVGGYLGVGFSLTEDFALLQSIHRKTNWKIIFPVDRNTLVNTRPAKNWREFIEQRKRWLLGGQNVHWFGKFLIATSLIANATLLGLMLFSKRYDLMIGFGLIILVGDYLLLASLEQKLHARLKLILIPIYRLCFVAYSLMLFFELLFNRKVSWKGIEYR